MTGFIHLLSSGANAILTLEGQNTTCADVFYAWVCIAYHLERVLASPSIGVTHHRIAIIGIYNHRFNQMMKESSHMIFLLAYYLHPCEFYHDISQFERSPFVSVLSSRRTPVDNACSSRWREAAARKLSCPFQDPSESCPEYSSRRTDLPRRFWPRGGPAADSGISCLCVQ